MRRDSPDIVVKWRPKSVEKHRRTLSVRAVVLAAALVLLLPALLGHFHGRRSLQQKGHGQTGSGRVLLTGTRQQAHGAGALRPAPLCLVQASNFELGQNELADASMYWWLAYASRHGYRYIRVLDKTTGTSQAPGSSAGNLEDVTTAQADEKPSASERRRLAELISMADIAAAAEAARYEAAARKKAAKQRAQCVISWRKPVAMKRLLPQCEVLAFLDLDVIMVDASTPMASLLQRWNFTGPASVLMAADPDTPLNYVTAPDGSSQLFDNTGFVVLRNRPRAYQILDKWLSCPTSTPGCDYYLGGWPCDQGAWAKFVRPALAPHDTVTLPCSEANSYPAAPDVNGCVGKHIHHYWTDKAAVRRRFEAEQPDGATRQELLARLQAGGNFLDMTDHLT